MFKVVAAQFAVSMVVCLAAWLVGGWHAGVSSMLGGFACAVPNALFALNLAQLGRLTGGRGKQGEGGAVDQKQATAIAVVLLAGEFLKVVLTVGLLVLIAWVYKDVVWLALIVAVIAVLMMQAAALVWR